MEMKDKVMRWALKPFLFMKRQPLIMTNSIVMLLKKEGYEIQLLTDAILIEESKDVEPIACQEMDRPIGDLFNVHNESVNGCDEEANDREEQGVLPSEDFAEARPENTICREHCNPYSGPITEEVMTSLCNSCMNQEMNLHDELMCENEGAGDEGIPLLAIEEFTVHSCSCNPAIPDGEVTQEELNNPCTNPSDDERECDGDSQ